MTAEQRAAGQAHLAEQVAKREARARQMHAADLDAAIDSLKIGDGVWTTIYLAGEKVARNGLVAAIRRDADTQVTTLTVIETGVYGDGRIAPNEMADDPCPACGTVQTGRWWRRVFTCTTDQVTDVFALAGTAGKASNIAIRLCRILGDNTKATGWSIRDLNLLRLALHVAELDGQPTQ